MSKHERIDYIEFPTTNIGATKKFFTAVFGWSFTDYGPDYCDFQEENINGGFYVSDFAARTEKGSVLVVFYSHDLEQTMKNIEKARGKVVKPTFSFPGGRRFHFLEPGGNELAVWSDIDN